MYEKKTRRKYIKRKPQLSLGGKQLYFLFCTLWNFKIPHSEHILSLELKKIMSCMKKIKDVSSGYIYGAGQYHSSY